MLADTSIEDAGAAQDAQALRDRIHAALARMERRDAMILPLRYGLHGGHTYTLAEVGQVLRITRERVRQLQRRAEERLRRRLAI